MRIQVDEHLLKDAIEHLNEWSDECADIARHVTTGEERETYTQKAKQADAIAAMLEIAVTVQRAHSA